MDLPPLPAPRGPLSARLLRALRRPPGTTDDLHDAVPSVRDPLSDDDLQLCLYLSYELHYRGLAGVDDRWEWEPPLLAFRAELERAFEAALRAVAERPREVDPAQIDRDLAAIVRNDDGPSLSAFVEREATADQVRELIVHRSAYQLKEADPHSFALPRLWGRPKSAMVEIQTDEYGAGKPDRIHADLYATMMTAVGLEGGYGHYLERLPGTTLATVNLASFFGLHRRLRGACVGHLALTEMTSSVPSRRYATGLRRLGFTSPEATEFYDEHVEADAVHESLAAVDLAGGLAQQEPRLGADVLFGARALLVLEAGMARTVLRAWKAGRSSLRRPLPVATAVATQ